MDTIVLKKLEKFASYQRDESKSELIKSLLKYLKCSYYSAEERGKFLLVLEKVTGKSINAMEKDRRLLLQRTPRICVQSYR